MPKRMQVSCLVLCVGCALARGRSVIGSTPKLFSAQKACILIQFLALCSGVVAQVPEGCSSRDVMRLNNGVHFKFVEEFYHVSGTWIHGYVVSGVPRDTFESTHRDVILAHKPADKVRSWFDSCLTRIGNQLDNRTDLNVGVLANPDITTPGSLCVKYTPFLVQMLRMIREDHLVIKQQVRAIQDLLPLDIATRPSPPKKPRGLFDFVGQLSSSLFGTAQDKDLKRIEAMVKKIADVSNAQSVVFRKSSSDLSSFSKLVDERFDGLVRMINHSAVNSLELWHSFEEDLRSDTDFSFDLVRKSIALGHAFSKLAVYQNSFIQSLENLIESELPSNLVTAAMINETIREIVQSLQG